MAEPIEKRTNKSIDVDPGAGNQSVVPDPDLSATTSADAYDAVERIRTSRAVEGAGLAVEGDAYDAVERIRTSRALEGGEAAVEGDAYDAVERIRTSRATGDEAPSHLQRIERDLDVGAGSTSAEGEDAPSHLQRIEKDLDTGEMSTDAGGEAPSEY